MTPEEILAKAADDLAKYGHHKGNFYSTKEPCDTAPACAYGAMARVAGMTSLGVTFYGDGALVLAEAARRLAGQIRKQLPDNSIWKKWGDEFTVITGFNDYARTTAEDVILAMKEAANDPEGER